MFKLSAYLNLLFDEGSFADRVDRVGALDGYDGFEIYGTNHDLDAIAQHRDANDLDWVYMSAGRPDLTNPDNREEAIRNIEETIEIAADVGCLNLNVKSGQVQEDLDWETQFESVVDVLGEVAPTAADAGVTLVLEPLNTRVDHGGHFTSTAGEGAEIVEAVDHPGLRLLFDFYHEQIMRGHVIESFREHLDVIGHVHIADNPGRNEPGTGEVNYGNVLDAVAESGYDGYVGCEFVPTGDPEQILADVERLARG